MNHCVTRSWVYGCIMLVAVALTLSGCTLAFKKTTKGRPVQVIQSGQDLSEIKELKGEVSKLSEELEMMNKLRALETQELAKTRDLLAQRLAGEKGVKVALEDRGIVITFLAEVLFDSGKDEIRSEAFEALDKVARVLNDELREKNIAIEGHTDNEPIKYSGWRSNWELSTARATSVLHYLVDEASIDPMRLQATGYGEFRPVADNETTEGRQQNRRVEIVILPEQISRVPFQEGAAAPTQSKK